jgi:hypothetical protein
MARANLAIKAFAFSPVSDVLALRQLLFPLLAAALLAPYFRRVWGYYGLTKVRFTRCERRK